MCHYCDGENIAGIVFSAREKEMMNMLGKEMKFSENNTSIFHPQNNKHHLPQRA